MQAVRNERRLEKEKQSKPLRSSLKNSFRKIFTLKPSKNELDPKDLSLSLRTLANHKPTPSPPPLPKSVNFDKQISLTSALRVALPLKFTPVVEEEEGYGHFVAPSALNKEGTFGYSLFQ